MKCTFLVLLLFGALVATAEEYDSFSDEGGIKSAHHEGSLPHYTGSLISKTKDRPVSVIVQGKVEMTNRKIEKNKAKQTGFWEKFNAKAKSDSQRAKRQVVTDYVDVVDYVQPAAVVAPAVVTDYVEVVEY